MFRQSHTKILSAVVLAIAYPCVFAFANQSDGIDLTHLPLGDGHLSSSPKHGYIWPCHIEDDAGGAYRTGPWIRSDGTYDFTAKAAVDGTVTWPHRFTMSRDGDRRVFTSNDLPDHATGHFPIAPDDDAYQYDRNPNSIAAQSMRVELPANPELASTPSCAPGAVGILLTGSMLFSALDAPGRDAVAHETQDRCQGHPQQSGVYHYHSLTTCLPDDTTPDGHSKLAGYALDGFGIYGKRGEGGNALASADLDECHGHTHAIEWDGRQVVMYHYHATWDFPYTIGCMRGRYNPRDVRTISGPSPQRQSGIAAPPGGPPGGPPDGSPRGRGQRPDLAAAAAMLGISEDQLRRALGPPPPDLNAAAQSLGISVEKLRKALRGP